MTQAKIIAKCLPSKSTSWINRFTQNPRPQMHEQYAISRVCILGDSLSDRGTLNKRLLFGFIPMDGLAGLKGRVPFGEFTNGHVWSDDFSQDYAEKLLCDELIIGQYAAFTKQDLLLDLQAYKNTFIFTEAESILYYINDAGQAIRLTTNQQTQNLISNIRKKYQNGLIETAEAALFFNNTLINELKQSNEAIDFESALIKPLNYTEIQAAINDETTHIAKVFSHCFSLFNDKEVHFEGERLIRSYAEGGLTSHDYSGTLDINPARLIVSTLAEKVQLMLEDDKEKARSQEEKAQTLVMEWTGANDLVTVNSHPTNLAADLAVDARIKQIKLLIKNGYRRFALGNLPNLALTPRYQRASKAEQDNAKNISEYFNETLRTEIAALSTTHPECSFELLDVYTEVEEFYNHPETYGFAADKKATPFSGSGDDAAQWCSLLNLEDEDELTYARIKDRLGGKFGVIKHNNKYYYADKTFESVDEIIPIVHSNAWDSLTNKLGTLTKDTLASKEELQTIMAVSGRTPADGYLFDDDLHPTAAAHRILAQKFFDKLSENHAFSAPTKQAMSPNEILHTFISAYKKQYKQDCATFFGGFKKTKLLLDDKDIFQINITTLSEAGQQALIQSILKHAFYEGGQRTLDVITSLHWVDQYQNANPAYQPIKTAQEALDKDPSLHESYTRQEIAQCVMSLGLYLLLKESVGTNPRKAMEAKDYCLITLCVMGFIATGGLAGIFAMLINPIVAACRPSPVVQM